jgi:DNA-binding MarR family transcriptional regulator
MESSSREEAISVLRAVLALGRRLRAERPKGSVTLSAVSILGTLSRLGPMAATQLATEERLQPQSLTRILAGLEQEGLIVRARSDADRREILIALNDRGRRVLADDIHARRVWLENAIAAVLNEKERDLLFASSEAMLKLALHDGPGDEEAAE